MGKIGREWESTPKAKVTPTIRDLEWAAGFMEGEGCFSHGRANACQLNPEPLLRLQKLFGGSIIKRLHWKKRKIMNSPRRGKGSFFWRTNGARSRGVMMTLYPLLSKKRQGQIQEALA